MKEGAVGLSSHKGNVPPPYTTLTSALCFHCSTLGILYGNNESNIPYAGVEQVCGGWQHEYEYEAEDPSPLPCRSMGIVSAGCCIQVLGDRFLYLPYDSVVLRCGRTILMAGGALREHCSPSCVLLRNTRKEL